MAQAMHEGSKRDESNEEPCASISRYIEHLIKGYIEHLIKQGTLCQYLKIPDKGERRELKKKRTGQEERARKGKGIEALTRVLNTITTTPCSNVRKRKIWETLL